jgi:hypothetical protein
VGLLKRKSKDPKLSDFWTSGITMLKINEMVELNPNWKLEKDGESSGVVEFPLDSYSFRAYNDGETLDTATLPGNFESETVPEPSLVAIDDEVILAFAENSIVSMEGGFFIFEPSDVIGRDDTESVKKDNKNRKWRIAGGALGTVVAGVATGIYAESGKH